jgi:hypothetical protein
MKYESMSGFAGKMDWEGGLMELVRYGLSEDELPDDMPDDIRAVIIELITVEPNYSDCQSKIYEYLE